MMSTGSGRRQVSIHASVKDATYRCARAPAEPHVSIHASVKDATFFRWLETEHLYVSIHASVKDATVSRYLFGTLNRFQSTRP